MKQQKTVKMWQRTRHQNLIRHKSGHYYARAFAGGKEVWKSQVFRVNECQKALDRACKKVGADRITHHDLRHLFATRCIESGVDIPTVFRWLGHKDGGALAMKTHGHLRREHSIAQAKRVTFAPGQKFLRHSPRF
jgi:integrase